MTAISASNFAALNDEGGEFYQPSSTSPRRPGLRREGRDEEDDDDGNNAIGEYDFHSPVGNTPWIVLTLLTVVYLVVKRRKVRAKE